MRFYDSPPDSLFLDGLDIREYSIRSLRDRLAFVNQDAFIFNDTIRANCWPVRVISALYGRPSDWARN